MEAVDTAYGGWLKGCGLMGATRAVIFDLDGVLVDSEALINRSAVAAFHELGHTQVVPNDFLPYVGSGEDNYLGGVAHHHQVAIDLAATKARTYQIFDDLIDELQPFAGAHDLHASCLAAGHRIAVASAGDRSRVIASLNQVGLGERLWDSVVCGDEVSRKKPEPDIFLEAAARLRTPPQHCTVIEDSHHGVAAAAAAGMRCIAVAQTFDVDLLHEADLVRDSLLLVTIEDLAE